MTPKWLITMTVPFVIPNVEVTILRHACVIEGNKEQAFQIGEVRLTDWLLQYRVHPKKHSNGFPLIEYDYKRFDGILYTTIRNLSFVIEEFTLKEILSDHAIDDSGN